MLLFPQFPPAIKIYLYFTLILYVILPHFPVHIYIYPHPSIFSILLFYIYISKFSIFILKVFTPSCLKLWLHTSNSLHTRQLSSVIFHCPFSFKIPVSCYTKPFLLLLNTRLYVFPPPSSSSNVSELLSLLLVSLFLFLLSSSVFYTFFTTFCCRHSFVNPKYHVRPLLPIPCFIMLIQLFLSYLHWCNSADLHSYLLFLDEVKKVSSFLEKHEYI
jgi:hypothetical protein